MKYLNDSVKWCISVMIVPRLATTQWLTESLMGKLNRKINILIKLQTEGLRRKLMKWSNLLDQSSQSWTRSWWGSESFRRQGRTQATLPSCWTWLRRERLRTLYLEMALMEMLLLSEDWRKQYYDSIYAVDFQNKIIIEFVANSFVNIRMLLNVRC